MDAKIKDLDVKIGELTVERDFLSRGLVLLISRSFRLFSAEGRERRDAGVDAPH